MIARFQPSGRTKRIIIAVVLAWLTAVVSGPTQAKNEPGGLLTITFDDAGFTQYKHGLPLVREFGVPGSLFVIIDVANRAGRKAQAWGMTWAQIIEFRDAGWEIGSHSVTHPNLTELPSTDVIQELEVSMTEIQARLGQRPVSFASPFGEHDKRTLRLIAKVYSNHVLAWGGNEGRNPIKGTDRNKIGRMDIRNTADPEAVCNEMSRAARNNTWLVILVHGIVPTAPDTYQISVPTFRRILECASDLRKSGRLRIVTLREGAVIASAR